MIQPSSLTLTRRHLLARSSQGLFGVALASLLKTSAAQAAPSRGTLARLPLPQKAKRVIWLYMAGGMSHLETYDLKPDGPSLMRSVFRPIATRVPGLIGVRAPAPASRAAAPRSTRRSRRASRASSNSRQ